MFFKSFMPEPTFGSSGSRRSSSRSRVSRADIKGSNAILTRPKPRQSRADIKGSQAIPTKPKPRQTRADIKGSQAILTKPKELLTKAPPTRALNDANGVGRRSAPVNLDTKSTASSGSTSGGTGGQSGKIKASKAQEDNLTVRKASRGTSKYKKNKLKVAKK